MWSRLFLTKFACGRMWCNHCYTTSVITCSESCWCFPCAKQIKSQKIALGSETCNNCYRTLPSCNHSGLCFPTGVHTKVSCIRQPLPIHGQEKFQGFLNMCVRTCSFNTCDKAFSIGTIFSNSAFSVVVTMFFSKSMTTFFLISVTVFLIYLCYNQWGIVPTASKIASICLAIKDYIIEQSWIIYMDLTLFRL